MSASMDLTDSVRALVLETLKNAGCAGREITLHTDLGHIGFDSLALAAIIARAESDYRVEFSYDHILEMFQSALIADLAQVVEAAILGCRTSRLGNV